MRTGPDEATKLGVLGLSARSYNCLLRAGIDTVVQLAARSDKDLLAIGNLGKVSLREIRSKLKDYLDKHPELGPPSSAAQARRVLLPSQLATITPTVVPDGTPSIKVLDLSVRTHNCLGRAGVTTVRQLAVLTDDELLKIRNLGPGSLAEIRGRLKDYLDQHPEYRAQLAPDMSKVRQQPKGAEESMPSVASPPITVLGLSVRASNCLRTAGVRTMAEVLALSDDELLDIRALGHKTLAEIRQKLDEYLDQHPEHRIGEPGAGIEGRGPKASRYRPPVVHPALQARATRIPLDDISIERLVLPFGDLSFLSSHGIASIGALTQQPADAFAPDSLVPEHLNQYLEWLAAQGENTWEEEVANQRVSPMHRLLLSDTTMDQLVADWLKGISKRQREVLRLRLGYEGPPLTLEEAGQRIGGVTRERVRQIQNKSLKRLKESKALKPIGSLSQVLLQEFVDAGGLMAEDEVCKRLMDLVQVEEIEPAWAARLLLHAGEEFEGPNGELWALAGRPLGLVPLVKEKMVELLKDAGRQVTVQELLTCFAATAFGRERKGQLDDGFLGAILRVSEEIELAEGMIQLTPPPPEGSRQQAAKPAAVPTTLAGWERRLRPQAAQVELLGEISITAEECAQLGKTIGLRLRSLGLSEAVRTLRQDYPCSLGAFLVAQGVYGYDGRGGYWPNVGRVIGRALGPNWQGQLGLLFETVLSDLGLPLFPDLGGRRYVDLILLHGGIPDYCLTDFFANLLWPGVTKPQYAGMSALELIDEWLWRASGRYVTDKPVLNFLEFGGNVVEDFVERCLEMARERAESRLVPEAEELGLPQRVVSAFQEWDPGTMLPPPPDWKLRKPEIVVDPWGEGVLLDLPPQQVPATEIEADITWQVKAREAIQTIPVWVRRTGFDWKTSPETFALSHPAAEYEVALLVDGEIKRAWRYQGVDDKRPLLVFDSERGTALSWKHSLPARYLGLLYPRRWRLKVVGKGRLAEELPRLPWGWADFCCQTWELSDAHRLTLSKGNTSLEVTLRPDEVVQRPYLEGGRIVFAGGSGGGAPVYVGTPPIVRVPLIGRQVLKDELARWRVTVRNKWAARPEVEVTTTLADLAANLSIDEKHVDLPLQLPSLLGIDPFGNFDLRLRGPLGRDAQFTLRIVPHLTISGHENLYLPELQAGPPSVTLRVETLPGYRIECQGMGEDCHLVATEQQKDRWTTQIRAEPDVTAVESTVIHPLPSGEAVRVPVSVPIHRLRWALTEEQTGPGRREWTGRAIRRFVDDLLQAQSPCLWVDLPRIGMDEVGLRLRLLDMDGEELQRTGWATPPAGQRLSRFELAAFFDTIRKASPSPILRFRLEAYGLPGQEGSKHWPVLSLTRLLLVENVELKTRRFGKRPVFELRWHEPTPLKNRHVRFWPLWRPWDPVYEQAIPDTAEGAFTFSAPPDRLRSGKYRLEFLVVDPWVPQVAQKPPKDTSGTVDVELISPDRQLQYLNDRLQGTHESLLRLENHIDSFSHMLRKRSQRLVELYEERITALEKEADGIRVYTDAGRVFLELLEQIVDKRDVTDEQLTAVKVKLTPAVWAFRESANDQSASGISSDPVYQLFFRAELTLHGLGGVTYKGVTYHSVTRDDLAGLTSVLARVDERLIGVAERMRLAEIALRKQTSLIGRAARDVDQSIKHWASSLIDDEKTLLEGHRELGVHFQSLLRQVHEAREQGGIRDPEMERFWEDLECSVQEHAENLKSTARGVVAARVDKDASLGNGRKEHHFELVLERALLHHDMGSPEEAQSDWQWCYEHIDDGTVPQILALADLARASGDREMLGKLQFKMFAVSRVEPVFQSWKQDQLSWEDFQAYLANLPRWERLPAATCILLLTADDDVLRLQALQQLVQRSVAEGVEAVLQWAEAAMLSDADAIAILSLNAGFAADLLRERTDRPTARRLLGALSHTVEDVVRVGNWFHCNLGWGRVERIEHLDSGGQVQWCIGGQSRYRLHAVLRPDVHPEMVTIDLASSTADFCERGAVRTCAECGHFMTRLGDLMPEHYRKAHPARGYWDRRYRRDEYAKFRFEDRPIGILSLEFVSEKPGEQLV